MSNNDTTEVQDQDATDQGVDTTEEVESQETTEVQEVEEGSADKSSADTPGNDKGASDNEPVERKVFSMPVAKAQKEKEKAVQKALDDAEAKFNAEREALAAQFEEKLKNATPKQVSDELKKVSEKHGLDPEATADLMEAFKASIELPDTSKYDQILKEKEIEAHKLSVSKEFDEVVTPLILKENPQATPEYIREVKGKIEELAFTEGYNTYALTDIYTIKKGEMPFKNGLSAETPGGRGPDITPFKKLSDEDEIKLADSDMGEYKKYLNWLRGQESKYIN